MKKKVSVLLEDALAAAAFLGFAAIASFSPEPVRKQVLVAPTVAASPQLLLPLKCDARVRQSDGRELPRARLLFAAEMPDARCYNAKGAR